MTASDTVTDHVPNASDDDSLGTSTAEQGQTRSGRRQAVPARPARPAREVQPPELLDFLVVAKRRWFVLLGVPLLAAALSAAYVYFTPTIWTATATVSAPALVGGQFGTQYAGSQAVNQFVAQFQAVASGPVVRAAAAKETGVAPSAILDGLEVEQTGASSVMQITFQNGKAENVDKVVRSVTTNTLNELFTAQVTLASGLVKTAGESLDKANQAIQDWETKNKVVAPDDVYRAKLTELSNLQQQAVNYQANGNFAGASAAKAQVATLQSSLARYSSLLAQYRKLQSTRDAAVAAQVQAEQQLQNATAQQLAADPERVVFVGTTHDAGKSNEMISMVAPVTAAGIFLGVVLVAVLEMVRASRRRSRSAVAHSDPVS